MNNYELQFAEYECALNEAADRWFNARPKVIRNSGSVRLFEAGFRMAWDARKQHIAQEINNRIQSGDLEGNGTDQTAERNGMILACNMVCDL